jgi:L-amino acid N-acyltransferase YncA
MAYNETNLKGNTMHTEETIVEETESSINPVVVVAAAATATVVGYITFRTIRARRAAKRNAEVVETETVVETPAA